MFLSFFLGWSVDQSSLTTELACWKFTEQKFGINGESMLQTLNSIILDDNRFIERCVCLQAFYKIYEKVLLRFWFLALYFYFRCVFILFIFDTHYQSILGFNTASLLLLQIVTIDPIRLWFLTILAVLSITIELIGRLHNFLTESFERFPTTNLIERLWFLFSCRIIGSITIDFIGPLATWTIILGIKVGIYLYHAFD